MGGGLTFLNKKTWHPGRMQNQEEKWKREQTAEKEAKKLAEIKTQIEQERQNEELQQVAVAAGVKPCASPALRGPAAPETLCRPTVGSLQGPARRETDARSGGAA
jgi:hypothetical protein